MMKTRKDNYVTNHTNLVYIENEAKLLWSIKSGPIYHEN